MEEPGEKLLKGHQVVFLTVEGTKFPLQHWQPSTEQALCSSALCLHECAQPVSLYPAQRGRARAQDKRERQTQLEEEMFLAQPEDEHLASSTKCCLQCSLRQKTGYLQTLFSPPPFEQLGSNLPGCLAHYLIISEEVASIKMQPIPSSYIPSVVLSSLFHATQICQHCSNAE